jgi:hypothetical protein
MKIALGTIDIDDATRRAISRVQGKHPRRKATREEVLRWAHATIRSTLEVIVSEHRSVR